MSCPVTLHPATIQALCDCFSSSAVAGIEQGIVPLGCIKDINGAITHKIFLVKTIGEDGTGDTFNLVSVDTSGNIVNPYVGGWVDCNEKDVEYVTETVCLRAVVTTANYTIGDQIQATWVVNVDNIFSPHIAVYKNVSNGSYPVPFWLNLDGVDIIGTQPNSTDFVGCETKEARAFLGSEVVASSANLTPPAGANLAEIYIHDANIRWTTSSVVPTSPHAFRKANFDTNIELESASEIAGFRWDAISSGTPVLYVEYFSVPLNGWQE